MNHQLNFVFNRPQGRLTAKEALSVARLPLPGCLQRLEVIFAGLNLMHSFLQARNIQVGRRNPEQTLERRPSWEVVCVWLCRMGESLLLWRMWWPYCQPSFPAVGGFAQGWPCVPRLLLI